MLPAGGGHQSVILNEPTSVATVTVSGTLSWPKGYHAPFSTTAAQPTSCGPALNAAVRSSGVANPDAKEPKYFVCKYVGTPGVDERLQTGQNPIDVSGDAIAEQPVVVGSFFNDAQGRSFVLAEDVGQPTPDVSECPDVGTPPTRRRSRRP